MSSSENKPNLLKCSKETIEENEMLLKYLPQLFYRPKLWSVQNIFKMFGFYILCFMINLFSLYIQSVNSACKLYFANLKGMVSF